MYNNTFTSVVPVETGSYLSDPRFSKKVVKHTRPAPRSGRSVFDTSSQYSIEVMRNHVRLALKDYELESPTGEIDYLLQNFDVFRLLPNLAAHLRNSFGANSKLTLELLDEGPQWQTLFININTVCDWEKSKVFVNTFLDNMFDLFPTVAEKLNININPDGV